MKIEKKSKKYFYEMTLEREVLREKIAEVLADIDRKLKNDMRFDDNLSGLKKKEIVLSIYMNVFNPEYGSMNKIKQAYESLDFVVDFLNK